MSKKENRYVQMGLSLRKDEHRDLIRETEKFHVLVGIRLTPQKFLMKLLADHIRRNNQ